MCYFSNSGDSDKFVGKNGGGEIAERINKSKLILMKIDIDKWKINKSKGYKLLYIENYGIIYILKYYKKTRGYNV